MCDHKCITIMTQASVLREYALLRRIGLHFWPDRVEWCKRCRVLRVIATGRDHMEWDDSWMPHKGVPADAAMAKVFGVRTQE